MCDCCNYFTQTVQPLRVWDDSGTTGQAAEMAYSGFIALRIEYVQKSASPAFEGRTQSERGSVIGESSVVNTRDGCY